MISNSIGWRKRRRGAHLSESSRSSQLCPALKLGRRCGAFNFEMNLRHQLSYQKEAELLAKAKTLLREVAELGTAEESAAESKDAPPLPTLQEVVESLKQEKEYLNWSLDLAVEERLIKLRRHRCTYSHIPLQKKHLEEEEAVGEKVEEAGSRKSKTLDGDEEEEDRVDPALLCMTPLQRLILILLRKQTLFIPRRLLSSRREDAAAAADEDDEDADAEGEDEEKKKSKILAGDDPSAFVHISLFDFDDGIVDLSSLPRIAPYVVKHSKTVLFGPNVGGEEKRRILRGFSSLGSNEHQQQKKEGGKQAKKKQQPICIPLQSITEKEVDFSSAANAQRLVEVLQFFLDEESQRRRQSISTTTSSYSSSDGGIVSLALRRCNIVTADHLVSCLKKHRIHTTLRALDLSYNDIESLRLLFLLRSTFNEQLLFLSLRNNPITVKPDYREQVKRTLPNIVSLDGEKIRSKPLVLPFPRESSNSSNTVISDGEISEVLDAVGELFHAWETQRVSIDNRDGKATTNGEATEQRLSVEIDEKTFAARYFSPGLFFSLTVAAGCSWFDGERMKLKTEVEFDDDFDGFRLSAIDRKELQLMDVCMRNASRSLSSGRAAVNRFTQGQFQCFTTYQSTLYPQRFDVDHHFSSCRVSVTKLPSMAVTPPPPAPPPPAQTKASKKDSKKKGGAAAAPTSNPFAGGEVTKKPAVYIVTLHGVMSWRTPSMQDGEHLQCAVDRTMTFIRAPRALMQQAPRALDELTEVERHHVEMTMSSEVLFRQQGKRLLLANDMVHLRPLSSAEDCGWCESRTERFVSRLGLEYGALRHKQLIRSILERSTSDASVHETLECVFPSAVTVSTADDTKVTEEEAVRTLQREASLSLPRDQLIRRQSTVYDVSGLCGVRGQTDQIELFNKQHSAGNRNPPQQAGRVRGGDENREQKRSVTLAQLDGIISSSNAKGTAQFSLK